MAAWLNNILFVFSLWLLALYQTEAKLKEGECEVCISIVQRFIDSLSEDVISSSSAVEEQFKEFCNDLKGKDERFCYYIGGLKTSASYILQTLAKPVSWHMPADKCCEKLKAADSQICDLKYDKQIDLAKVDFKKLKVKDLKKILSDWGEDNACRGCAEKSEFVHAVKELMPKYAPEAAKTRTEL